MNQLRMAQEMMRRQEACIEANAPTITRLESAEDLQCLVEDKDVIQLRIDGHHGPGLFKGPDQFGALQVATRQNGDIVTYRIYPHKIEVKDGRVDQKGMVGFAYSICHPSNPLYEAENRVMRGVKL